MTQYYRAGQAYGATSSYTVNNASSEAANLRNWHKRIATFRGVVPQGTLYYGTPRALTGTLAQKTLAMPDAVYAALSGIDVSDALYNSSTPDPAGYSNTSEVPSLPNLGLHRQVIFCVGSSLTNCQIGAGTTFPQFSFPQNRFWAMGLSRGGTMQVLYSTNAQNTQLPSTAPQPPEWGMTLRTAHEKSRIKFNFGRDSWRLANQAGMNYQSPTPLNGSPHIETIQQLAGLTLHSSQQLVIQIESLTNDFNYADQNSNGGLSAVPAGTPGYTYAGSPNAIDNSLKPYITAIKALYPNAKIRVVTPWARGSSTSLNGKFVEFAAYCVANKAALGIDQIIDARQIPLITPTNLSASANGTIFNSDQVHLTPPGVAYLDPWYMNADDALLGFTPDPAYASAIA
jgi:hypothetical protein